METDTMFEGMDMNALLAQAQQMQADMMKAQEDQANRTFEGTSGGGLVTAQVSGLGDLMHLWAVAALYQCSWVDSLHGGLGGVRAAPHDDVARQQQAHVRFRGQCPLRKRGAAGTEDEIIAEGVGACGAQFGLENGFDIDFGEDAKALFGQGLLDLLHGLFVPQCHCDGVCVAHVVLPVFVCLYWGLCILFRCVSEDLSAPRWCPSFRRLRGRGCGSGRPFCR